MGGTCYLDVVFTGNWHSNVHAFVYLIPLYLKYCMLNVGDGVMRSLCEYKPADNCTSRLLS